MFQSELSVCRLLNANQGEEINAAICYLSSTDEQEGVGITILPLSKENIHRLSSPCSCHNFHVLLIF